MDPIDDCSDADASDLEERLAARRSRGRRAADLSAWATWAFGVFGAVVIVAGAVFLIGNQTGKLVTFPYAGTLTIAVGIFLCGLANEAKKHS